MALGVPVIAADRDFAREACANAALYASPHSGDDLADKLERILSDQNLASAMATEGRKRVEETVVSWQSVAERYLAILRSLGEASG
jgi:glycosyltransferase involved in cell wall biosynthesis